ncbi:MAG: hypothetical protein Q9216_005678 [Gyalolechia sp. 2 TL-2023]
MADSLGDRAWPDGIFSILDTDLYKLTMQCAILKYLPDVQLANVSLTPEELDYLQETCPYFSQTYLQFLTSFRLQPSKQVHATFTPRKDTGSQDDEGDVQLDIEGRWLDTILYEIPLLALTSEAYFKFCDQDWTYKHQESQAYDKGCKLLQHGCIFSEFGSRRRRDYHTHDLVIQGLKRAAADGQARGWKGKLSGSSNVHFAMKYGIPPVGTVAHEWFMGIASITNDYEHANETALRYWVGCFGEGVLGIALTDTFGTPTFLKAFKRTMPTPATSLVDDKKTLIPGAASPPLPPMDSGSSEESSEERSYAQIFQGVRQDSGSPMEFVKIMRDFYESQGIQERKTIVFSDSLNIELMVPHIPTNVLPDDFAHESNGQKSVPLNIVIKLSSANGHPAIKISDNIGKNTGDSGTVHKVKETLGYIEKQWANGDETSRWGNEPTSMMESYMIFAFSLLVEKYLSQKEKHISTLKMSFAKLVYRQLFLSLPYPQSSLNGQTVVVTGANTGLGFEAARHYVRLGATKVILAVRSLEKGEVAKKAIEDSEKRQGVLEVWHLDLQSYESVKEFAQRIKGLPRLDIMLENAGIATFKYNRAEDNEATLTVNVVSTFLLALLVLPKLRETSTKFNTTPYLTIVTSGVHAWSDLPERKHPDIFQALNDEKTVDMQNRYPVSKLLEVFYSRELAARMKQTGKPDGVTLNLVSPGLCHTELSREGTISVAILKFFLAQSAEAGSRNLLWATTQAGPDSHGKYIDSCGFYPVSPFVTSPEGIETQRRIWDELSGKLEKIQPGIMANV